MCNPRGGWHFYFVVPEGVDPNTLRQPDAIKHIINVRCIGYTVAAGSYYHGTAKGEGSGYYIMTPDAAAPYVAPEGLVKHCTTRPERVRDETMPIKPVNTDVKNIDKGKI